MGKAINNLVDIIRDIIQDEISKEDDIILCQVKNKKDNNHYDIVLASDPTEYIYNIVNTTPYELLEGDYVYTYKIKNNLSNSFIINKIVPYISESAINGALVKQLVIASVMGYEIMDTSEFGIGCSDGTNLLGYSEV